MKLWSLLFNEWRFCRMQPLFWLSMLLALAFAALVNLNTGLVDAQPVKALLLRHSMLLMTIQPLLIGVLASLLLLRDSQHGISALIEVTAQSRRQRLVVRALGLWLCAALLQLCFVLLVALVFSTTYADVTGILRWSWQLLLVQQLPALALLTALALWCSCRSQSPIMLYLQGAAVWLGYMLLAAATGSPLMANSQSISPLLSQLMVYLDPYALTPVLAQLRQSGEMPAALSQLNATFWLNRLLIITLAGLLCWRALQHKPAASNQRKPAATTDIPLNAVALQYQPCPPDRLRPAPVFAALLRLQWQQLCFQYSTLLAMLALCLLVFSEVYTGLGYAEAFSQLVPDSRDALNRVSHDVLPRFGLLLTAFWAHQLSWLNRQQRIDGLVAATPLPSARL